MKDEQKVMIMFVITSPIAVAMKRISLLSYLNPLKPIFTQKRGTHNMETTKEKHATFMPGPWVAVGKAVYTESDNPTREILRGEG